MKAVRIHDYGGPEAVCVETAPRPIAGPDELLVRVQAWGVNPVDAKIREGLRRERMPLAMPATLGCDLSGVVKAGAAGGFKPGDAVFAMTGLSGAFSEYVAIKAEHAAPKPAVLDHVEAAAVPLAALTAWQGLDLAGMQAGDRVLVLAGGGGVGGFAVQLAASLGAEVTATASAEKIAYVRSLGAHRVVDYRGDEPLAGFDIVFDLVGGQTQDAAWSALKPGGFLVTAAAAPPEDEVAARGMRAARVGVRPDGAQLRRIGALIEAGKVRVHVEATYPLTEASAAIERVRAGRTRGKIVLTMD